jgi:hypothetical protein
VRANGVFLASASGSFVFISLTELWPSSVADGRLVQLAMPARRRLSGHGGAGGVRVSGPAAAGGHAAMAVARVCDELDRVIMTVNSNGRIGGLRVTDRIGLRLGVIYRDRDRLES